MRYKDEQKQDAIIIATVKLVNEIGFVACSVSKIAKEAKVSPATLYIYYRNKEDLLVSTYMDIKRSLSMAILKDFDESQPVRDIVKAIWLNTFDFISRHPEKFQFTEQFANSPYSSLVDKDETSKYFEPLARVVRRGIEEKIIKDVPLEIIKVFIFHPVMILANIRLCSDFEMTRENIETAFMLAWDAICV